MCGVRCSSVRSRILLENQLTNTGTKTGSPRLTSKLSVNQEQFFVESKKRKLDVVEADENKRPRKKTSTSVKTARRVVHETENATRMLQKICDANPSDVIFRAAHEHAKQLLCAANFDLCQLESLRRTNSAP